MFPEYMIDLTHFSELRNLLKKYSVWAKKRLGQNFLVNKSVLEKIVETAEVHEGELIVEIGPGPGVLTQALLLAKAKVEAIEIDREILPVLREATRSYSKFLTIFEKHILDFDPPKEPYKIISNIPYHLTSPILRKFLSEVENRPSRIVLLVQKEVAEKICEKEGRDSHLSLMVKVFGVPEIIQIVRAESFFPVPKVDSAILKIELFSEPKISIPPKVFEEMLFRGFAEPRKKIRNVLMKKFLKTSDQIEEIFTKCNVSGDLRAQNLSIEDWENLAKVFFEEYIGQAVSNKQ